MTRRRLSARVREHIFDDAHGVCHICRTPIQRGQPWEVSHPIPLAIGGKDDASNWAPAHVKCHAERTAKIDARLIAKTRRQRQKDLGIRSAKRPMSGGRRSPFKRTVAGRVVWRETGEPVS